MRKIRKTKKMKRMEKTRKMKKAKNTARKTKKSKIKPIIIVNFKTYKQSTGKNALKLAKIHQRVARKTHAKIMVAVQNADVYPISHTVSIPVLAQHADPVEYGKNTGKDLPECLKDNGAWGCIINHSEDRMPHQDIKNTIIRCKEAGLKTVVCAESISKAFEILKLGPDYIAFEDPNLIGTLKSVSKLEPDSVKRFATMVEQVNKGRKKKTIPLCGAGIANSNDVVGAVELGTKGVLVATAIVKSHHPARALKSFVGK